MPATHPITILSSARLAGHFTLSKIREHALRELAIINHLVRRRLVLRVWGTRVRTRLKPGSVVGLLLVDSSR